MVPKPKNPSQTYIYKQNMKWGWSQWKNYIYIFEYDADDNLWVRQRMPYPILFNKYALISYVKRRR